MRRAVSVTAIVGTLFAGSALAAAPVRGRDEGTTLGQVLRQDEDVSEGMRALAQRMTAQAQAVIEAARAGHFVAGPAGIPGALLAAADARTEKVTFLGVATERVSEVLAEQLKLPRGVGLVVQYVEKDSPAEAAGLKVHDIVEKFEDQWVVNQEQFTVLVRMKKAGEEAGMTVLRGGEHVEVKVKLAEKEVPLAAGGEPGQPPLLPGQGSLLPGEFELRPGSEGAAGRPPGWTFTRSSLQLAADGTMDKKLEDNEGSIDLKRGADGKTLLVVKDTAGKEIFSGPYDTAEDKAKAPAGVAAKVASLDAGVHLQTGGGAGAGLPGNVPGRTAVMTRTDGEHVIQLQVDGEKKRATVRDSKTGAVIFDGPVGTDDERKTLPAGVREKVEAMETKLGGVTK